MVSASKGAMGREPARVGRGSHVEKRHDLTRVFKALSSETRVDILRLLDAREHTVTEITSNFKVAQPSISRHLSILSEAHLVHRRREGQRVFYGLEPDELSSSLEEFCGHFRHLRAPRFDSAAGGATEGPAPRVVAGLAPARKGVRPFPAESRKKKAGGRTPAF